MLERRKLTGYASQFRHEFTATAAALISDGASRFVVDRFADPQHGRLPVTGSVLVCRDGI